MKRFLKIKHFEYISQSEYLTLAATADPDELVEVQVYEGGIIYPQGIEKKDRILLAVNEEQTKYMTIVGLMRNRYLPRK